MAYAYLFKYIIIGDTGKRGRPGAGGASAGPGSPFLFPQCWRRRRGGFARWEAAPRPCARPRPGPPPAARPRGPPPSRRSFRGAACGVRRAGRRLSPRGPNLDAAPPAGGYRRPPCLGCGRPAEVSGGMRKKASSLFRFLFFSALMLSSPLSSLVETRGVLVVTAT